MSKHFWQRLGLLFLILLIPMFILKEYRHIGTKKQIKCASENLDIPNTTKVSDKSFVVIIPALNNLEYFEKNLNSVLSQVYPHIRVIYIDQGSTDGSFAKAKEYIKKNGNNHSIEIIESSKRENPFLSYYRVVHACKDDEIVIHLDGNDWLAHEKVISLLNRVYASDDVWLTYGQYLEYPSYKKGIGKRLTNRVLTKSKFLKLPWIISHLKTYYAGLFKRIKIDECTANGDFPTMDEVTPFVLPMIQRAKKHVRFIPEVLYIHNSTNKGDKLSTFAGLPTQRKKIPTARRVKEKADVVVFAKNHPISLSLSLQSMQYYLKDLGEIIVVYEGDPLVMQEMTQIKEQFSRMMFIDRNHYKHLDFKTFLTGIVLTRVAKSPFVALATDDVIITKEIALSTPIDALKRANAYGFYFHLDKNAGPFSHQSFVGKGIYSWKTTLSPDCMKLSLYDRNLLQRDFSALSYFDLDSLLKAWKEKQSASESIGLFYHKSPIFIATFSVSEH